MNARFEGGTGGRTESTMSAYRHKADVARVSVQGPVRVAMERFT
jgi:hypothetical protein